MDLRSGRTVATLELVEGVEDIFDVQVAAGVRGEALRGSHLPQYIQAPIWIVLPLGVKITTSR